MPEIRFDLLYDIPSQRIFDRKASPNAATIEDAKFYADHLNLTSVTNNVTNVRVIRTVVEVVEVIKP